MFHNKLVLTKFWQIIVHLFLLLFSNFKLKLSNNTKCVICTSLMFIDVFINKRPFEPSQEEGGIIDI